MENKNTQKQYFSRAILTVQNGFFFDEEKGVDVPQYMNVGKVLVNRYSKDMLLLDKGFNPSDVESDYPCVLLNIRPISQWGKSNYRK